MIPGSTKGHLEAWGDAVTVSASEEVSCAHCWAAKVRGERGVQGDIQVGHPGRGVLPGSSWLWCEGEKEGRGGPGGVGWLKD